MMQRFPLTGLKVKDLCPLNDTDPPLSFSDLGIESAPPISISYQSPNIDSTTYWQPGLHP